MPTLAHYLRTSRTRNINRAGGRASPHKPCMLLAALGMSEAGDQGQAESVSSRA